MFGLVATAASASLTATAGRVADVTDAGSWGGPIVMTASIVANALFTSFTALAATLLFFDLRARASGPSGAAASDASQETSESSSSASEHRDDMTSASTSTASGAATEAKDVTARRVLRRQLLLTAALVGSVIALVMGARLAGISFAAIDRPLFVLGGLAAVAVLRAGRSVWRVSREGIAAALPAAPEPLDPAPRSALDAHDEFLVAERFRFFGGRYELSVPAPDGRSPGERVAVVDREAFAAKERFEALQPDAVAAGYVDASRAQELQRRIFRIEAMQVLDAGGRYRVDSPDGDRIGELRKVFATSLFRATWEVWDGAGTLVAIAQERSLPVALLRRTIGLVPVVGDLLALLPIAYQVDVHAAPSGQPIATFTRLRTFRDRYTLRIDADPHKTIDRRLALALAVSLDAL